MADIVNLPEDFLYELLPDAIVTLDERFLICAVVGGYEDRVCDLRSYGQKLWLFFSPVGLPESGPNVVMVDLSIATGRTIVRSLDLKNDTPVNGTPDQLAAWAATQL